MQKKMPQEFYEVRTNTREDTTYSKDSRNQIIRN